LIEKKGRRAYLLQADLADPRQVTQLFEQAAQIGQIYALVNNASIFDPLSMTDTSLEDWQRHMDINLTAPFLLSQAFAKALPDGTHGRIINILDWRALRPQADHFPYTISKAGLAALTRASAVALAPNIIVNAVAFGAILPPSDGGDTDTILESVPAGRWAEMQEVTDIIRFLLAGPAYITGEVIHLDGGRHLV
jgi:NAD(P)-dependent dehydrogenase (short-subunit alcohol dehydrogenase family)